MKFLPQTKTPVLRLTVIGLAATFACFAVRYLQWAAQGELLYGVIAILLWLPLSVGLWRLLPPARDIAQAVLWLIVIVIPLGTLNPFAAMDELGPGPPPAWEVLLFWVAPWVVPALFAIHVLGKFKSEFRRHRDDTAS